MFLAALVLLPQTELIDVSYGFGPSAQHQYNMTVTFDGMIPILGGQEGKASVALGVLVRGLKPEGEEPLRVSSELTKAEFVFNGAKLPLGLENVQDFFPKTTISATKLGKITKSDAPDISLPIKLPGLDVKRFPDISYLPVEFGVAQLKPDMEWSYTKPFGGSNVTYKCKVTSITEKQVLISLELFQEYEVTENEAMEVTTEKEDAVNKVKTVMKGYGKAVFDRALGVFLDFEASATAVSEVTPLDGSEKTKRELKTSLKVKLVQPGKPG